MPAIQRSEFALALNQIATERGVDPEIILESIKTAILAAYRKDHVPATLSEDEELDAEEYTAEINSNTGETSIMHEGKNVTPPGFGRIATQTAKQVLLQSIKLHVRPQRNFRLFPFVKIHGVFEMTLALVLADREPR